MTVAQEVQMKGAVEVAECYLGKASDEAHECRATHAVHHVRNRSGCTFDLVPGTAPLPSTCSRKEVDPLPEGSQLCDFLPQ